MSEQNMFVVPESVKQRKDKIDEMLAQHEDIGVQHVLPFLSSLSEETAESFNAMLDSGNFAEAAQAVREFIVREFVRNKLKEIVRKKPGGGYVVYKPKDPVRDKDKPPQKAGEVPSLASAYQKLATYTKDPQQKERLLKRAQRARKPAGSNVAPPRPKFAGSDGKKSKKEGIEVLKKLIEGVVVEKLFREENLGSEWDDYLGKVSSKVVEGDPKFANLTKKIEKTTEAVLKDAFNAIKKSVGKGVKVEDHGIKKNEQMGKTYLSFSAMIGNAVVEPIYVYCENGIPKIEMSQESEVGLTKAEPDAADLFRGRIGSVQEKVLSKVKDLTTAIAARDKYLEKLEAGLDNIVSGLTPLQLHLLKFLLMKKYRKI